MFAMLLVLPIVQNIRIPCIFGRIGEAKFDDIFPWFKIEFKFEENGKEMPVDEIVISEDLSQAHFKKLPEEIKRGMGLVGSRIVKKIEIPADGINNEIYMSPEEIKKQIENFPFELKKEMGMFKNEIEKENDLSQRSIKIPMEMSPEEIEDLRKRMDAFKNKIDTAKGEEDDMYKLLGVAVVIFYVFLTCMGTISYVFYCIYKKRRQSSLSEEAKLIQA